MAPAGPGHAARCVRLGELAPPPRPEAPPPGRRGEAPPLLTLDRIEREFGRRRRFGARPGVRAADGVSFAMRRGETLALVGESGSGKSTLARLLIGLDRADAGTADFGGRNIAALPAERRPAALIRALQMVFQNPDGTLNPAHRVGRILARALRRAGRPHGPEQVAALLDLVRLPPEMAGRRPGALSGGQRQRVAIARAFAGEPELILADEPVSALDVSVQAAVVTLLGEAQAARDTAILLISHDLMLVRHVADRVVVLYRGRVMEQGTAAQVFSRPSHPYTEALMAAVHPPDPDHEPPRLDAPDDPGAPPQAGCPFQPRCHRRVAACADTPPPLREQDGHAILCHHERAVLSDPPSRRGAVA
jgi:peptide/nickel transport system ATP-binding protein